MRTKLFGVLVLLMGFVVAGSPAVAQAAVTGCGGPLAFGVIVTCPSIVGDQQNVYTVTTTKKNDVLYSMLTRGDGDGLGAKITDADGNFVCFYTVDSGQCAIAQPGTYTITVALDYGQGSGNYTFAVQSMRTPSSCRNLPNSFFSFANAGLAVGAPFGGAAQCFRFDQPVGSVLRLWPPEANPWGDVQGQILDNQYQPICTVRYAYNCTLSSSGPYHLFIDEHYGAALAYTLRMSRISDSMGCPVLRVAAFGDPGARTGTGTLGAQDTVACHKIRAQEAESIGVRINNGQSIWWTVFDRDGAQVCDKYDSRLACSLPAAGDYTLMTINGDYQGIDYEIAATALSRPAGCAPATLNWNQWAAVLHQTSPVQQSCQQFQGAAGQRVISYGAPDVYNDLTQFLVDSAGKRLCADLTEEDGCLLPAAGRYRLVSFLNNWDPASTDLTYKTQVRSLSDPKGCPVLTPGAYNAAPAGASGPIRCRTLRISAPGAYIAKAFDGQNYQTYAKVYDRTGHRLCTDSGYCAYPAAGDYTMVLGQDQNRVYDNDFSYVTALLPYQPTGCTATAEVAGQFSSAGEYQCLQLPQPAGASIAEVLPNDGLRPTVYILDSDGNYLCDSSWNLRQYTCTLSGTAPYLAVLSSPSGTGPGPVITRFVRTDGPPDCPALDSTEFTTGGTNYAPCFSLATHSARESFTWHRASGTGAASLSVFDAAGIRRCGPGVVAADRTQTCSSLPDGPLTVILETAGTAASYTLTHQAVS